jgi:amino acid transporter
MAHDDVTRKGLSAGKVGLLGGIVIGISCVAPAYTLTAALGPMVAQAGVQTPALFLVGFIPMILIALGYRELNSRMPDAGTSFTWGTRAFGPWVGWMVGWGLLVSTIIVISSLASVACDFTYVFLSQVFNDPTIADLTHNTLINILTTVAYIALACWISYRGIVETEKVQVILVVAQLLALGWFAVAAFTHVANGTAFDATPVRLDWFDPARIPTMEAFAAGISLSIFVYWGWDVTLTMNEEMKDPKRTPGRAATLTMLIIVGVYLVAALGAIAFAGVGTEGIGIGNPDNQDSIFATLAAPVLGPFAVLMSLSILSSSAASLQSTFVSPARTLLAMGYYGAMPKAFARTSHRFNSPSVATLVAGTAAALFYVITRLGSESVLWDTIAALGMMICFYYGLTALSCVWYFRRTAFSSARGFFLQFLAPLLGGLSLIVMFIKTCIDSMDPAYGSGSSVGGVGFVFIIGISVLLLGAVIMVVWSRVRPEFFRNPIPEMADALRE